MLARGLSVRDIEDAFRDENGRLLLSKGEQSWRSLTSRALNRPCGSVLFSYNQSNGRARKAIAVVHAKALAVVVHAKAPVALRVRSTSCHASAALAPKAK
jgi:hypothetical protein